MYPYAQYAFRSWFACFQLKPVSYLKSLFASHIECEQWPKKKEEKKKVNLSNNFEAYNCDEWNHMLGDHFHSHIGDTWCCGKTYKNSSNLLQRKGTHVQHIYHNKKVAIEK